MFGGSYEGYSQWATAKSLPPHLATFVPVASVGPGIDFPFFKNISYPYVMQWLILTSGHVMQDRIFADAPFWRIKYREWFESGRPFHELDAFLGSPSPVFQQWMSHPEQGPYWDAYRPSAEEYGQMRIPILTITGSYDADQWGALHYYREHLRYASREARARHFLVIGPWDHGGTLNQKAEFRGVKVAPAGLLDILGLHAAWYAWTMQDGPRPEFLQKTVAYYVMGAEEWRYADTLEEITTEERQYFLGSTQNATDVLNAGLLSPQAQQGLPDSYVYDPHDVSNLALNVDIDPDSLTDQRLVYAGRGRQLVYHTAPFETDTEISGFFRLSVWISIDRPDTDFRVTVHEIAVDGTSTQLAEDQMRARYREGLGEPKVVLTRAPQRYDFTSFNFISRQIKKGSRLRLVIGPIHSIYSQRNYNGGGTVSEESIENARAVKVTVFHDRAHPSALQIPLGQR
jgi:putative CocE/NonD family hydrolase